MKEKLLEDIETMNDDLKIKGVLKKPEETTEKQNKRLSPEEV